MKKCLLLYVLRTRAGFCYKKGRFGVTSGRDTGKSGCVEHKRDLKVVQRFDFALPTLDWSEYFFQIIRAFAEGVGQTLRSLGCPWVNRTNNLSIAATVPQESPLRDQHP
jgi:hypothetical protein